MRTRLSEWQIKGLKGSGQLKYLQINKLTPSHVANDVVTYPIDLPEGADGVNIKTISVQSDQSNNAFIVMLMDGATENRIYESREEIGYHYDNIDIPYKPTDKKVYVRIHNRGSVSTKFKIDIRGIEVN